VITVDEEDEESAFVRVRKRHWARLSAKVWKENPEIFPQCGARLEVLSAFVARQLASQSSPAQDDVIERILRCRGEWPGGLRAVALRLRDQPSSATTLRAVAALSGRSAARELASHPPWERERQPRGPPKQLEMFAEQGSGVPICNPEDENQDPPGDAWME